jgi:plasmid stability protein
MKAQIRQLDDHVLAALRARAQAQGLSLEQSLRDRLTANACHGHALRDALAPLRATMPSGGR